jgi:hypothetical protein
MCYQDESNEIFAGLLPLVSLLSVGGLVSLQNQLRRFCSFNLDQL